MGKSAQTRSLRGRRRTLARAVLTFIAGLSAAAAALSASASATVPSPPPGAPAVESAPSSLTGLSPQLPSSVITASAARVEA
jgi:hypothetical protein